MESPNNKPAWFDCESEVNASAICSLIMPNYLTTSIQKVFMYKTCFFSIYIVLLKSSITLYPSAPC